MSSIMKKLSLFIFFLVVIASRETVSEEGGDVLKELNDLEQETKSLTEEDLDLVPDSTETDLNLGDGDTADTGGDLDSLDEEEGLKKEPSEESKPEVSEEDQKSSDGVAEEEVASQDEATESADAAALDEEIHNEDDAALEDIVRQILAANEASDLPLDLGDDVDMGGDGLSEPSQDDTKESSEEPADEPEILQEVEHKDVEQEVSEESPDESAPGEDQADAVDSDKPSPSPTETEGSKGLSVTHVDSDEEKSENDDGKVSIDITDFQDIEAFQPKPEWQKILPGQSIPAGLHVRMNLQTGEKEARLMPESEKEEKKEEETGDSGPRIVQVDKIDKRDVEEAMKKFEDKFPGEVDLNKLTPEQEKLYKEELSKKYRCIDELKKDLEGYDLFPKTDAQIMLDHVKVLNDSSSTAEQKQKALDELEFLVHQVDNGRDLDIMGGLQIVVRALDDADEGIRLRAAYVLGSAAQSNPPVQEAALKMGSMPTLLNLLSSPQQSLLVRRKVMAALSSMVRLFPAGREEFLRLNGMSIFLRLFGQPKTETLRLKAVILVTDLITEEVEELRKDPKGKYLDDATLAAKSSLLPEMVHNGWCERIFSLLKIPEDDVKEKVIQAIHLFRVGCMDFLERPEVFSKLDKLGFEFLRKSEAERDPDMQEYLSNISKSVTDLLSKLVDFDDE